MSRKDKDFFIENFAMLIDAKMDVVTSLETLEFDIKEPSFKKKIRQIKEEVADGTPLSKAFEGKKVMPEANIALIRIGENSGRLAENLKLIEFQHRKERQFKKKVQSAMMYPVLILILTMVIGIGIAWYILPRLADVFNDLDVELPLITSVLIDFGRLLQAYGLILLPLFAAVVSGIVYVLFFNKKTRFIGQNIIFVIPVLKQVVLESEMARFGQIMGNLLSSGLPILDAMESFTESSSFSYYTKFYTFILSNLKSGNSFQKTFAEYKKTKKLLPHFVQQILIAGEKSGQLPASLKKVGDIYEEKIDLTTKNLTVILEPLLLLTIWVSVIGVALAVILPIYSLIGGFI